MSRTLNILKLFAFGAILIISFYITSSQDTSVFADQTLALKLVVAMISGIFYASFLTAPLAVVLFVILTTTTNIYLVALFGGLGAVTGDLLIIKFFRTIFKPFSFLRHGPIFHRFKKILKTYHLDIIGFIFGAILIASPFPDELGLILLGASSLSYFKLAILSFFLNSGGILIILIITKAII